MKCELTSQEETPEFFKFHYERFKSNAEKIKEQFSKDSEYYKYEVNGEIEEILSKELYQEMSWELFSRYEKTMNPEYIEIYYSFCEVIYNLHEDKRLISNSFNTYLHRIPSKSELGNYLMISISLLNEIKKLKKTKDNKHSIEQLTELSKQIKSVNAKFKKLVNKAGGVEKLQLKAKSIKAEIIKKD
jgi:hypothetical protein